MKDSRILGDLVEDPKPTPTVVAAARAALRARIETETLGTELRSLVEDIAEIPDLGPPRFAGQRVTRKVRAAVIAAAALVTVIVAAVTLATLLRAGPATALLDLANVVEALPADQFETGVVRRQVSAEQVRIEPLDLTDASSGLVVMTVQVNEVRTLSATGQLQISTAVLGVSFLTPVSDVEAAEITQRVGVGESVVSTFESPSDLGFDESLRSTDAAELSARLHELVIRFGQPDVPDSVEVLNEIRNLHFAVVLSPQERAASLRAIAKLDGLAVTESGDGTLEVTADYVSAEGRQEYTLSFDSEGWLVRETLTWLDCVPGTTVAGPVTEFHAIYQRPELLAD